MGGVCIDASWEHVLYVTKSEILDELAYFQIRTQLSLKKFLFLLLPFMVDSKWYEFLPKSTLVCNAFGFQNTRCCHSFTLSSPLIDSYPVVTPMVSLI